MKLYGKKDREWEVLRIGCFNNEEPVWGLEERLRIVKSQKPGKLKAFIGGTQDAPEVMLYDGGYGLSMLDLYSGEEKWNLRVQECYLGDAGVSVVDENGTCYIAGTDGPDPVAVSQDGEILWRSAIEDPTVYGPYEMTVNNQLEVKYRSGSSDKYTLVAFDLSGQMISSRTEIDKTIIANAAIQTDEIETDNEAEMIIQRQETEENKPEQTVQENSPTKEKADIKPKDVEESNNNANNNENIKKENVVVDIELLLREETEIGK